MKEGLFFMRVVKAINPNDLHNDYILVNGNYDIVTPVKKYLDFLKATGKSPNTIKNYCYHLKTFFSFLKQRNLKYNNVNR